MTTPSLLPTLAQQNEAKNIALSQLLIASEGDIKLVVERYNYNRPEDDKITSVDVLQAFLSTASKSLDIQDAIKASMLLTFLEMLRVTKDHLLVAIPEFEGPALLRTFRDVVTAIAQILPQPAPIVLNNNVSNVNNMLNQFGADQARDRVVQRLQTIKEISDRYPESIPSLADDSE